MLKRRQDIEELLIEVGDLLVQIETVYKDATENEDIIHVAKPKVKSCLEHLRSCLDYIATDLSEMTGSPKTPRRVYFPYGKDKEWFSRSIAKNLPELIEKYVCIIEKYQPYQSGDQWLIHLCDSTNFNKHIELQQQSRVNSDNSETKIGNLLHMSGQFGSITIGKVYIDGELKNPKGPLVVTPGKKVRGIIEETGLDIPIERKYEWVKFALKGTELDVRELLIHSHKQIGKIMEEIYGA